MGDEEQFSRGTGTQHRTDIKGVSIYVKNIKEKGQCSTQTYNIFPLCRHLLLYLRDSHNHNSVKSFVCSAHYNGTIKEDGTSTFAIRHSGEWVQRAP